MTEKLKAYSYYLKNFIRGSLKKINSPPIISLLYHRVGNYTDDPQQLSVSVQNFEKQISFLASNFNIASTCEDWSKLDKPTFTITFDDGYEDNLTNALPILEKYKVPATVFITTSFLDDQSWPYSDSLFYYFSKVPKNNSFKVSISNDLFFSNEESYFKLCKIIKPLPALKREEILSEIISSLNISLNDRKLPKSFLTTNQLIRLDSSPLITIGAHTENHPMLSTISKVEQRKEIAQSLTQLENILKKPIRYFAYPYGTRQDYNKDSVDICKELPLDKVYSNFRGHFFHGDSLLEIPRHLVGNWKEETFKKKIKSFLLF
jgi:peptidoglycan/xylan/chitin deacetylase (PgdA/CDA1 family)